MLPTSQKSWNDGKRLSSGGMMCLSFPRGFCADSISWEWEEWRKEERKKACISL